jgi:hypothetical protein
VNVTKVGAVLAITGALAFGGIGMSAGVADARPGHGHGDWDYWNGDGNDAWRGGPEWGPPPPPCGAAYWVPPAVSQWVPPAAWAC